MAKRKQSNHGNTNEAQEVEEEDEGEDEEEEGEESPDEVITDVRPAFLPSVASWVNSALLILATPPPILIQLRRREAEAAHCGLDQPRI